MSFTNFFFYPMVSILFLIVALNQFIFRKKEKISNTISKSLLLIFSYIVMSIYDWWFCLCITVVILITYCSGILIEKVDEKGRKAITRISVIALVGMLGIFKYLNFFMSTIMTICRNSWTTLNIILPVGISFYIFSAVSYVLDVSWGNMKADRSLLDVALFLSFFPKQLCGPIVKGREFLPQLKENRRITLKNIESGLQIFVFGLFKKIVLADHLAVFVDGVYASTPAYGTATIWLAVFSYYLQLYFDFSGYSDMAIGMSKIFGYEIRRNFNLPFISKNIDEFWDRWHISLTSWFNEYLFNPIAMKMKRKMAELPKEKRRKYKNLPTYVAVLITFLVSGLWHGAGFTFLVWGLCQGVLSVAHAMYGNWTKKKKSNVERKNGVRTVVCILANYVVLNLIQVFFRAESNEQALYIYRRMFTANVGLEQPYTWAFFSFVVLILATVASYRHSKKQQLKEVEGFYYVADLNTIRGLTCFFVFAGLTICLAYFGETYFIYGNF